MRSGMGRQGGGGFSNVRQFYGVQDFQDTATATTPIAVPNGSFVDLTNDGLGPLSSQAFTVLGHDPIFDTSTNSFDFTDLKVGDMVFFRIDVEFTTSSPNTGVGLQLAFGPSLVFTLPFDVTNYKPTVTGDEGRRIRYFSFQMKTTDTVNNPAKIQATADATGVTCIVNGWQMETMVI